VGIRRRAATLIFALLAGCNGSAPGSAPDEAGLEDVRPAGEPEPPLASPDGAHLTTAHCGLETAYPPGTFVYVGGGGTEGRVGSSLDGLAWEDEITTSRGDSFPGHTRNLIRGATYGGGVFVLVGGNDNAYIVTSCDGVDFRHDVLGTNVEADPPPAYDNFLSDAAYEGGVFVAAGGGGKRLSSFDHGLTWEETGSFVAGHFREVEAGDGRFVAVGASFDLTRALSSASEDGRIWSEPLIAGEPLDRGLAFGRGVFVAVGETRCAVSEDGRRWDECELDGPDAPFLDVQFVDGRFLVQLEGRVLESDDGRRFHDHGALAVPANLVEGPDRFVFATPSERGASDGLTDFEVRPLPQFRALTGGVIMYSAPR
jgi:hypothetical protein